MTTEMKYDTHNEAFLARRDLINQGVEVSLIAYDPDRDKFVFDQQPEAVGATEASVTKPKQLATVITVRENSESGPVVARFVYSGDAQAFAEKATEREPDRVLFVHDRAGYVSLTYRHGFTIDL